MSSSPPSRIGPYVIVEAVAAGAFSNTYRARHEELGRDVYLRTLKPSVSASTSFALSLEREAKVLASLDHEAFLELYELGRRDGAIWIAMEDVEGASLVKVLEGAGKLVPEVALAIGVELAKGLGHAHARGVVLRGLRPDAIAIAKGGAVKITDLAGAEARRITPPGAPDLAAAEGPLAPLDYASPEQILGERVGPATDIFSLGVVLYEMLSGSRPFGAPGGDKKEIARRIRQGAAEPLPSVAPGVPRDAARAVMRCLARDPTDRFESADALGSALSSALASLSMAPTRVLCSRALAAAKLGDALLLPGADPAAERPPQATQPLWYALRAYLLLFALIVAGALVIELGVRDPAAAPRVEGELPRGGAAVAPGYVRALASPWAEVFIDGQVIDTTPIGRPIPVSEGRHFLTFRHPNAPDEKRSIVVASGQTVVVDVTMRVDRGAREDAGVKRSSDASDSP